MAEELYTETLLRPSWVRPFGSLQLRISSKIVMMICRIPWTGDRPIVKPVDTQHKQETRSHASICRVGFHLTIAVLGGLNILPPGLHAHFHRLCSWNSARNCKCLKELPAMKTAAPSGWIQNSSQTILSIFRFYVTLMWFIFVPALCLYIKL
jgi:hypothetical protein